MLEGSSFKTSFELFEGVLALACNARRSALANEVAARQLSERGLQLGGLVPALLVGAAGFEPATFRSQSGCATRLRYAPSGFESSPCS